MVLSGDSLRSLVPDLVVVAALAAGPHGQDDEIEHQPPLEAVFLDHAAVGEKFLQIAPHRPVVGRVRRAEIDQQHADAARDRRMVLRARCAWRRTHDCALVGDHLAVVRQRAGRDELHRAFELGDRLQRRGDRVCERGIGRGAFRHAASSRPARPRASTTSRSRPSSRMARGDLGDLLGMHEHAFDLGGLVGAAHPALDAHVGAPAGRDARHAPRTDRRWRAGSSDSRD